MPIPVLLSLALLPPVAPSSPMPSPPCRPQQLRIVPDGRDGDFNGMSHSGTALSIRNTGRDCTIPALPRIELRDARNRALPAMRQPPVGMHPGPVMVPVRIAGGHRAVATLRWVSGPVFPHSRQPSRDARGRPDRRGQHHRPVDRSACTERPANPSLSTRPRCDPWRAWRPGDPARALSYIGRIC